MRSAPPANLKPRKAPRQARATVTLDAIFEATIQVLVTHGPHGLTTTRVAKRAGVSVGTMYQYFPHKQSLFYAANERYLDVLAEKVEAVCRRNEGTPIEQMVKGLVATYWGAKAERPEVTRALYRSVAELDNELLIDAFGRRVDMATAAMFSSASDADFVDFPTVNLTLLTTIFGTVRNLFERNLSAPQINAVLHELALMCVVYLESVKITLPEIGAVSQP